MKTLEPGITRSVTPVTTLALVIDESGNDKNRTVSNSEFSCCYLEFLRPIFNSCARFWIRAQELKIER